MSVDPLTELRTERGEAMGSTVQMTTDASLTAVRAAHALIDTLERHWSRFRPDSEICRANAGDGPSMLQPATARIIEIALAGHRLTSGWFDPTVGTAARGAGEVMVDGETGSLSLPPGVSLDLGGIGKGRAADLAASILADDGASFSAVSVGGDVRVRAIARALVEVESPTGSPTSPLVLGLRDGGVAMSGPCKRVDVDGHHHLIDPFTGQPAGRPRTAVVVAATTTGAEILATAAAIAPPAIARNLVIRSGAAAWLVEANGSVATIGATDAFLIDRGWTADRDQAAWSLQGQTA